MRHCESNIDPFPKERPGRVMAAGRSDGHDNKRNQLANCELLTMAENGPGGKGNRLPDDWFADKNPEYLKRHLIPTEAALWKIERFEDFIEERKKLLRNHFKFLLVQLTAGTAVARKKRIRGRTCEATDS